MTTIFALIYFILFLILSIYFPIAGVCTTLLLSTLDSLHLNTWLGHIYLIHITAFAFVCGSVMRCIQYEEKIKYNSLIYSFLLIVLAELLSISTSLHPLFTLTHALQIILYLSMAFFIAKSLDKKLWHTIIYLLQGTIIISFIISTYSILFKSNSDSFHATGGFADWNFYPIYLMSLIPFIAWETQQNHKSSRLYFYLILFCITLFLAVSAGSRTGMVIIVFSILTLFPMQILPKKYLIWLIPVIFLAFYQLLQILGHYSLSFSERFAQWFSSPRLQDRFYTTTYCFKVFAEHPLLGIGSGQIEKFFAWDSITKTYQINSTYTTIPVVLAELGILGGLAYTWMGSFLISEVHSRKSLTNDIRKCAVSSLIIICFSSLFFAVHYKAFIWCWLGTVASLIYNEENEE